VVARQQVEWEIERIQKEKNFVVFKRNLKQAHAIGLLTSKLSDSPYLTRKAEMLQTLLECDMLNVWAIDLKFSPYR
jgi:hypothetical protein